MVAMGGRWFHAARTIFIWVLSQMVVIACLRNPVVLIRKTVERILAMAKGCYGWRRNKGEHCQRSNDKPGSKVDATSKRGQHVLIRQSFAAGKASFGGGSPQGITATSVFPWAAGPSVNAR